MAAWYDGALEGVRNAFNAGDFSLAAAWIHDDAVFDWSRSISDNRGVHRGPETMRSAFEEFVDTWDRVRWEVTNVDELGPDRILVATHVTARPRGSEGEIEARGAQLLEFRDGKIAQITLFQGREQALAEVSPA